MIYYLFLYLFIYNESSIYMWDELSIAQFLYLKLFNLGFCWYWLYWNFDIILSIYKWLFDDGWLEQKNG